MWLTLSQSVQSVMVAHSMYMHDCALGFVCSQCIWLIHYHDHIICILYEYISSSLNNTLLYIVGTSLLPYFCVKMSCMLHISSSNCSVNHPQTPSCSFSLLHSGKQGSLGTKVCKQQCIDIKKTIVYFYHTFNVIDYCLVIFFYSLL